MRATGKSYVKHFVWWERSVSKTFKRQGKIIGMRIIRRKTEWEGARVILAWFLCL